MIIYHVVFSHIDHRKKYVRRILYPNKICKDQIDFLEMMTQHSGTRPTRTMKLKKMFKPGNEDLFQEREYCIDMKQDNISKDKDFLVEICMEEMKENNKFRQVYLIYTSCGVNQSSLFN